MITQHLVLALLFALSLSASITRAQTVAPAHSVNPSLVGIGDTLVVGAPDEDSNASGVNGDGANDDA